MDARDLAPALLGLADALNETHRFSRSGLALELELRIMSAQGEVSSSFDGSDSRPGWRGVCDGVRA